MQFLRLNEHDSQSVNEMSKMATAIVREHFDPIIGKQQNNYMLAMFQTPEAIHHQLQNGYRYYFAKNDNKNIGFLAFYPKKDCVYLSKFYLYQSERGKGYSHAMLDFVKQETLKENLHAIELNVNKHNDACIAYEHLGFHIIKSEKNDIGHGYYMDDYVYRLDF